MDFVKRFLLHLQAFLKDDDPLPPYPLCPDEWEDIQRNAEALEQAASFRKIGIDTSTKVWAVACKEARNSRYAPGT